MHNRVCLAAGCRGDVRPRLLQADLRGRRVLKRQPDSRAAQQKVPVMDGIEATRIYPEKDALYLNVTPSKNDGSSLMLTALGL